MASVPKFRLNTGAEMPAIGMGCWAGFSEEEAQGAVTWFLTALKAGYRHFDTAWLYGTEKYLGEAIRQSGIPREELWINTKLPWHHDPALKSVEKSLDESLRTIGIDYVDSYLLHWPQVVDWQDGVGALEMLRTAAKLFQEGKEPVSAKGSPAFNETWKGMEAVYRKGKARNIGVSNFSIKTLNKLLETAAVVPAINQVEMHPYLVQEDLKVYCDAKGIRLVAYTATGYSAVLTNPVIVELAEKYRTSAAQVVLAWHLARGVIVVPKSADPQRQKDNLTLPALDPKDVQRISTLDRNERYNKAGPTGKVNGWTHEQLGW
ncbi:NADP-dependent oxidoreductase domain-containing protein [Fomitopsis serialis]|uniref:NADP-dependent oxidoreductase domain-containing protein n=1 Tax=Fomitopsis serialis TaxID=139415 RepID=UPI0020076C32|nr:NADP-dependent oxidoreductase domain-containing protein [Neoantrodia serialis]KAH9938306.1 NADP-dependent oxidoreductase domain-containing protein [Neoantrodia serialis]